MDQEAEGFDPEAEGTPLVPISQESVDAMGSELFKKLLLGVGVVPPFDEQVLYSIYLQYLFVFSDEPISFDILSCKI